MFHIEILRIKQTLCDLSPNNSCLHDPRLKRAPLPYTNLHTTNKLSNEQRAVKRKGLYFKELLRYKTMVNVQFFARETRTENFWSKLQQKLPQLTKLSELMHIIIWAHYCSSSLLKSVTVSKFINSYMTCFSNLDVTYKKTGRYNTVIKGSNTEIQAAAPSEVQLTYLQKTEKIY
jgi:hypothetical protein